MKAELDNSKAEITIDIISDYFHKTKEFLSTAKMIIEGGE
jgi:hypothetical protein